MINTLKYISLIFTVFFSKNLYSQEVNATDAKITSMYIYQFAKNTFSTDTDPRSNEYKIVCFGDDNLSIAVYDVLKGKIEGKFIGDREIEVYNYTDINMLNKVDLLYVTSKSKYSNKDIKSQLKGYPTVHVGYQLTYGDPMFNFIVKDHRIAYSMNSDYINKKNIIVDQVLIKLAAEVISTEEEWDSLLDKIESQIEKSDKKNISLNKEDINNFLSDYRKKQEDFNKLEKDFEKKEINLDKIKQSVIIQENELAYKEIELERINATVASNEKELLEKNRKIKQINEDLKNGFEEVESQKKLYAIKKAEIQEQEKIYNSQKLLLLNQETEINEKNKRINKQESSLSEQGDIIEGHESTISSQKYMIYFSSAFLIVFLLASILIFRSYRAKNKAHKEIELQKEIVDEKNREILDSIIYAKRIQSAILPPAKLVKQYLKKSFILYKPKDIVAGDFYWIEHKKDNILFAAADCTGHGVPGAMVSVVCNNALNRSVREYDLTDPGKILDKTREIVISEFDKSEEDVKDGMDIALCILSPFDLKTGKAKLQYAGANNPLWIIRSGCDTIEETKANKQPIGKFDLTTPYSTHTFTLQKGDSVYIFSDGYVDQFGGPKGKKFKAPAFRELLLSINKIPMEEQRLLIDKAFEKWRGTTEQIDDVCVIGLKI